MHMHAILLRMRTTIEITDEQRSRLMALAALRNEKGFSKLVREALDEYLESKLDTAHKVERALEMRGVLDEEDADAFARDCAGMRENWR